MSPSETAIQSRAAGCSTEMHFCPFRKQNEKNKKQKKGWKQSYTPYWDYIRRKEKLTQIRQVQEANVQKAVQTLNFVIRLLQRTTGQLQVNDVRGRKADLVKPHPTTSHT